MYKRQVAEGAAEKQAVYENIAKYAEPGAVVASCSSSMDAEILAGLSPKPENLLIDVYKRQGKGSGIFLSQERKCCRLQYLSVK